LWDIETGQIIRVFAGHERGLACLDWSGNRLATGSNDKTIRVWDVNTGVCLAILFGHADLVRSLVLDGESDRLVSGSYDRTVRLWNASTGDQLVEYRKAHKSLVFDVHMDVCVSRWRLGRG
jgi:WD40 repeat protein